MEKLVHFPSEIIMSAKTYEWIRTGMKKVCVGCADLAELLALVESAKTQNIPAYLVTDAGHTELEPGTITCAAFGPDLDGFVDGVTGHLKLL